MISTLDSKTQQLANGYYQYGSGPLRVLIMGSCRTLAYLNYLTRWNDMAGNPMTIMRLDPTDLHWNAQGEMVNFEEAVDRCEKDQRILSMLHGTHVFIHEYYRYYGMFNTDRNQPKHIYQFGMGAPVDMCIPNFHDHFVLFTEQLQFDGILKANFAARGVDGLCLVDMKERGLASLEKFYEVCRMSSFPEFGEQFLHTWNVFRYFWTGNHISRHFSLGIFRLMNSKYLHLDLSHEFWAAAEREDQFAQPCTPVTKYDVEAYGLCWDGTTIEELKLP